MTVQAEREVPTILVIPQPAFRRAVAIATIVLFLAIFSILPWKLGFERFFESLTYFSATWLVIILMGLPVALFARLAFPPRHSLARLEVSRDCVRVVPGKVARLFAEKSGEIDVTPQTREILLCHNVWQGLGDGLRLVVRAADGTERQIRATAMDYLNAQDARKLADGISMATGLPVLLSIRRQQTDGTVQDAPWSSQSRRTRLVHGAELAMVAVPFIGGAVAGGLWPIPLVIVVVGLGLWLSQMGVLFLLARCAGLRQKFPAPYSLTTLITFAAAYSLAVVVVGFIFGSR